jgi:8-oxo-dGTP diphosphatase
MDENHPRIAIDTLIVDKDGHVLLQLLKKPPKAGYWTIPGRQGESMKDLDAAIIEELLMELNAEIQLKGFLCVNDRSLKKGKVAPPVYLAEAISRNAINRLPDVVEQIRWFHLSELPKKLTPNSKIAIQNYYSKYIAEKSPEEQAIEELKELCSSDEQSSEREHLDDETGLTLADMEQSEALRRFVEQPIPSELGYQLGACFNSAEEEKRSYKVELTFNPDKTFEIKHLQPKAIPFIVPDMRAHLFLIVWNSIAKSPKPRHFHKILKEIENGMWGRHDMWPDFRKRCLSCTKYIESGRKRLYCNRNCRQEFSEFFISLPSDAQTPEQKKIQEQIIADKITYRLKQRWIPPN